MSGFLRRLRRPKEGEPEPEEESSLVPDGAEELPAESDGSTEPAPEVASEPDAPAPPEPEPRPEPLAAPSTSLSAPASPSVAAVSPAPVPAATAPTVGPTAPSGPPPPLPQADTAAARGSLSPRRTSSRCFMCGTDLDGPWCPTCRIAWNE